MRITRQISNSRMEDTSPPAISASQITNSILLALVSPVFLLWNAYKSTNPSFQHFLIIIFFTLFGATMLLGHGDAFRHHMRVELVGAQMSFTEFMSDLYLILTFQLTQYGAKDVYNHVLHYFFGSILGMPQLYFPFVGMVYGFFYGASVIHVLRNLRLSHANYILLGLVFVFLFIKGPEGIQTVRTWTGLWVLVYATLKYHEERKLRYLFLMFLPPFIHHAYFFMAIPVWLVVVFGSRPLVYSCILLASTFTTILPTEQVSHQIGQTERGASAVANYTREASESSAFEEFLGQTGRTNWYNAYRRAGLQRWAPTLMALALIASGIYFRVMTLYQKRIFSSGILMLAFSNSTWFLFAVHNRTLTIAMVFILAAFLMTRFHPRTSRRFTGLPPYYQWGMNLSLLLYAPLILFILSLTLDRLSVFMLGMPFIVWIDPEMNISLKVALNTLLGRG